MGQLTSVTSDRGSPAHGRALLLPCLRRCGGSWTGSRRRRRGYRHRHLRAPPTSVGDLSICSRSEWGAEPNCSPRRAPPEPHSAEGDVVGGMALPPPHERRGTRRLRRQCRLETSDDRLVAPPHGRRLVSGPCPSKDGRTGVGCVAAIHYETRKPHLPRPVRPPVASADLAGTPRARKLRVGTFITAALMWEAADLDYRDLFVRDGNDPDCCGLAGRDVGGQSWRLIHAAATARWAWEELPVSAPAAWWRGACQWNRGMSRTAVAAAYEPAPPPAAG